MSSMTAHQPEPTLRERFPTLFVVTEWEHLIRPRRRDCPDCGRYVWLDVDRDGRYWAVCSACGWEEML